MRTLLRGFAFGIACMAAVVGSNANAAEYPSRNIRFIVGFPPGGSTDIVARLMGQWLSKHMHQQFIIENKPGAGNNLGTEAAINSPPDGYTVFLVNPANAVNASLYQHLNFNFIRDMAPVAGFIRVPNIMEVNPRVPPKTVAEFIAYAKAHPGAMNMGSGGIGTSVHLSGELFKMMTNINIVHVPYRGAGPALTGMLGNQVQVMFDNLPSSLPQVQAGKLRALAVTTDKRAAALPDVPTVAETVPGYEASAFFGMSTTKNAPREAVDTLNKAVNAALADPEMQKKLAELGGTVIPGTPEDFGKLIAEETDKWAKVVKAVGLKVE